MHRLKCSNSPLNVFIIRCAQYATCITIIITLLSLNITVVIFYCDHVSSFQFYFHKSPWISEFLSNSHLFIAVFHSACAFLIFSCVIRYQIYFYYLLSLFQASAELLHFFRYSDYVSCVFVVFCHEYN